MTNFSYVCFTKDDDYIDLLNILIESIEYYSEYPLYIYLVDYPMESISRIKFKDNSKVKLIKFSKNLNCKHMYNYKAHILTDFIINEYSEYACYLDIDSVITPNCDLVFEKIDLVSGNVPISCIHPDNIGCDIGSQGDYIMASVLESYGVQKCSPFVHNDLILFSRNNLKFMYKWSKMCIESNRICIWDEYIYNVLLWMNRVPSNHYLDRLDFHIQFFNTHPETRDKTYIYHGLKNINELRRIFENMKDYYTYHPLTVYESPFQKIRLGKDNDGGYIIGDISEYDSFLSCGIGNDYSFENDFVEKYKIPCCMFDNTIEKLVIPNSDNIFCHEECSHYTHIQKNISDKETDTTTNLKNYFSVFNNIFLKMDIEGDEELFFNVVDESDLLKIKQLVIEIHDCKSKIPTILSKTHYLIHIHGNNYGGIPIIDGVPIPNVFELTYIRKDCFTKRPMKEN
jgi:hypothetical protein